jgi:hypothetical protein
MIFLMRASRLWFLKSVVVLTIFNSLDLAVLLHLEDLELLLRHGGGRVGAAYAAVGGSG